MHTRTPTYINIEYLGYIYKYNTQIYTYIIVYYIYMYILDILYIYLFWVRPRERRFMKEAVHVNCRHADG